MVGTTISHYKVLEKIGQGGMGEVYRAEDTNLSRDVAIKVLPEQFTQDPQRLARFEREAKLLASLNHSNIAAIHSFEHSDDIHFLVLEVVPGETLAERVAKGPRPVEEALEACRQIAEGVEAAHEKGVIHRDLKPANVKVTPEGKVKILDFGLAKAFEADPPVTDISQSPTLTEEMTRAGVILGTAAYMSPEQAKGEAVDKRADIFAFGCVLYELLTGKRAFEGETITETLGAIIHKEPDWEALPGATPWRIQDLLRRCLTKDVHDRLDGIGNVRIDMKLALAEPTAVSPPGMDSAVQPKRRLWAMACVGLVALTIMAAWNLWPEPTSQLVSRLAVPLPPNEVLAGDNAPMVALSPDGTQLAYVASSDTGVQIYLRALDAFEARPLAGTRDARNPFFSPDGQWIGFFAGGDLKKVSTSGGAPVTLCNVGEPRGATWGPNDIIIFALSVGRGLMQVSASGGAPQQLTTLNEGEQTHRWPQLLTDGRTVLFTIGNAIGSGDDGTIAAQRLDTGERQILIQGGSYGRYVSTGHLVYYRAGTMMAVSFDLGRLEVLDTPAPVLEGIRSFGNTGVGQFDFSNQGSLVYVPGLPRNLERTLVWLDREGASEPLGAPLRAYLDPRLSPDGNRLAVRIAEENSDIWTYDLQRRTLSRLTFATGSSETPVWTPDGKRVTFAGDRDGVRNLIWRLADGSAEEERLVALENHAQIKSYRHHCPGPVID